jgi:hypothetical protein
LNRIIDIRGPGPPLHGMSYEQVLHNLREAFDASLGNFIRDDQESVSVASHVLSIVYGPLECFADYCETRQERIHLLESIQAIFRTTESTGEPYAVHQLPGPDNKEDIEGAIERLVDVLKAQRRMDHLRFVLGTLSARMDRLACKDLHRLLSEWTPPTEVASSGSHIKQNLLRAALYSNE